MEFEIYFPRGRNVGGGFARPEKKVGDLESALDGAADYLLDLFRMKLKKQQHTNEITTADDALDDDELFKSLEYVETMVPALEKFYLEDLTVPAPESAEPPRKPSTPASPERATSRSATPGAGLIPKPTPRSPARALKLFSSEGQSKPVHRKPPRSFGGPGSAWGAAPSNKRKISDKEPGAGMEVAYQIKRPCCSPPKLA